MSTDAELPRLIRRSAPRLRDIQASAREQRGIQQPLTDALALARLRNADFVHLQLCAFVGVDIVDAGRHSDDAPRIESDCEMMPLVSKKLRAQAGIDWTIKHLRCDMRENLCIIGAQ